MAESSSQDLEDGSSISDEKDRTASRVLILGKRDSRSLGAVQENYLATLEIIRC